MSTNVINLSELSVTRLTTLPELADIADRWNELAGGVPFRSWEWLSAWWRFYCGPQDRLCTLVMRDAANRIVAIAPWYVSSKRGEGRVIRFLGGGEVCSDYVTVLCEPTTKAAVTARLMRWLTEDASGDWDLLELSSIAQGDELIA